MKGQYRISVENRTVKFRFSIDHNISVIRGNSATGKTTLVDMIRDYESQGEKNSGITVLCSGNAVCHALDERHWQEEMEELRENIIFIDEGNPALQTRDFAEALQHSDNYYCLFTRQVLPQIPYSVDAIYEIRKSGKYGKLKQTYNHFNKLYGSYPGRSVTPENIGTILTEDQNAGYQFWMHLAQEDGIRCVTAKGKSNIYSRLQSLKDSSTLVVADGAAFGPEMEKVDFYMRENPQSVFLYLPESFEWILLKAEAAHDKMVQDILASPYDYIDSSSYESWEQFFTALLVQKSKGTVRQYQKSRLNPYYISDGGLTRVRNVIHEDQVEL